MLKVIFELLVEPLGLPIPWYWEYVILAIIGSIAYELAYDKVGNLYSAGLISGRNSGSNLHWLFRLLIFVSIWALAYIIILFIKLLIAHWQMILMAILGVLVLVAFGIIIFKTWRK